MPFCRGETVSRPGSGSVRVKGVLDMECSICFEVQHFQSDYTQLNAMNNGHAVLGQLSRKRDSTSQMQVAANLAIEKRIKSSGRKKQNPVKAARKKEKERREQIKKHAKLEELKRVIKRDKAEESWHFHAQQNT